MDGAVWGAAVPRAIPGVIGKGRGRGSGEARPMQGCWLKPLGRRHKPSAAPRWRSQRGEGKSKRSKCVLKNPTGNPPSSCLHPPKQPDTEHRCPLALRSRPRPWWCPADGGWWRGTNAVSSPRTKPYRDCGAVSPRKSFPTSPMEPYTTREVTGASPLHKAARPAAHPQQTLLPRPAPPNPWTTAPQVPKLPPFPLTAPETKSCQPGASLRGDAGGSQPCFLRIFRHPRQPREGIEQQMHSAAPHPTAFCSRPRCYEH